jgi:hypothetical protein
VPSAVDSVKRFFLEHQISIRANFANGRLADEDALTPNEKIRVHLKKFKFSSTRKSNLLNPSISGKINFINETDRSWRTTPPPIYNNRTDEKIRRLGFALLLIWIMVICWITKDYWCPSLASRREKRRRMQELVVTAESYPSFGLDFHST